MSKRLKALLVAAITIAAASGGAVLLKDALRKAAVEMSPPMTCKEFDKAVAPLSDPQNQYTFFVGLKTGVTPPEYYGTEYAVGSCAGGVCAVSPGVCGAGLTFTYELGTVVGTWRIFTARASLYSISGIRAWAADNPTSAKFLGSWGQVVSACLTITTAANCKSLLSKVSNCWMEADGSCCRNGITQCLSGTDARLNTACTPSATARPFLCNTDHGAGAEMVELEREYTEADFTEAVKAVTSAAVKVAEATSTTTK